MQPSLWFYATCGAAALIIAFLFLPALIVVPVSFTDQSYLSMPVEHLSLEHYQRLIGDPQWRSSILQSIVVAVVATTGAVALGTLAAIGCWKMAAALAEWVRLLMLLPLIVPTVVGALSYYRLYIDLGLLDTYLGVIIAHVVAATPFVFLSVLASLAAFDPRIEQAARSMGASTPQVLRRIIFPSIRPGILSGAIFAFIVSWDELVTLLFITSRNVYLLPRAMWDGINENVDPSIAAVATLLMIVTSGCLVAERLLRRQWGRAEAE